MGPLLSRVKSLSQPLRVSGLAARHAADFREVLDRTARRRLAVQAGLGAVEMVVLPGSTQSSRQSDEDFAFLEVQAPVFEVGLEHAELALVLAGEQPVEVEPPALARRCARA